MISKFFSKLRKLFNERPSLSSVAGYSQKKDEQDYEYWVARIREKYAESYRVDLNPVQYQGEYAPVPQEIRLIQTENKGNPNIFYSTGIQSILGYLSELEDNGYDPSSLDSILEFGVGYARLIRHFIPFHSNLYGCDVMEETVQWCRKKLGSIAQFRITNFEPPLPYADEMFDFIFANSVFTHIQYVDTHRWIDELHRITKPGGCVITSHYDVNEHLENFDPTGLDRAICEKGYVEWGNSSVRENNIYFSQKKLKKIWGRKFDVLEYRNYFKDQGHLVVRRPK